MAPRRHGNGNAMSSQLDPFEDRGMSQVIACFGHCCTPAGECLRGDTFIRLSTIQDCVKVSCSNETCAAGQFMHRECFDAWEQTVLAYLKSCGRARCWSERQRHQNLWTKKGYDLVFMACSCKCGRGHLRKDLEWVAAGRNNGEDSIGVGVGIGVGEAKKKKRRNRQNGRPNAATATTAAVATTAATTTTNAGSIVNGNLRGSDAQAIDGTRIRAGSLSSSTGSSSPPANSETSVSPLHQPQVIVKKKNKVDFFGDRIRQSCGANGIFSRRLDFSAFNSLPRTKLNSYHIKMEDEGNHGNDDTRCFILSTLAALQWSRVSCVLCRAAMLVFDRYPLVDGTFFLSPRQHSAACAEVKVEGRTQFLSAVCISCLEGSGGGIPVRCRSCTQPWDGSSLVLGTMYSYDIFAAMPCCAERLKCNSCHKPLIYPHQRLNFYSDYSRVFACPHCRAVDAHFVKPLTSCFTREHFQLYSPWP
ncbi:PREDICTED: headcase protein [Ceratosolen solmsi marchali]|uniref:Headcase protein n=1 Tax=Ceratosolen solmsi marchali TaxID=326594 RepID=A0AAJ7DVC8_9HYME|nr:PREDICTED: headcase protein [Ceratosolen solmsi marchali]